MCHAGEMLSAHLLNHALQCLPKTCTPLGESFEMTALRKPQNQCLKVCATPGESLEKVVTESLLKRKCLTANRSTTNQSKPFTRDSHTIHKGFTQFWILLVIRSRCVQLLAIGSIHLNRRIPIGRACGREAARPQAGNCEIRQ